MKYEEKLVAYRELINKEKLVAYQELINKKSKKRRETGCVPGEEKLVAYQEKRNWLCTRSRLIMRREIGCVPRID